MKLLITEEQGDLIIQAFALIDQMVDLSEGDRLDFRRVARVLEHQIMDEINQPNSYERRDGKEL